MSDESNELLAAVDAERQQRRAAEEAWLRDAVAAAGRIFDALSAAAQASPGSPETETVTSERLIPEQSRTVRRPWPLPPKIEREPQRVVQESSDVLIGKTWAVTVRTMEAEPEYRWRQSYNADDWRKTNEFTYKLTIRDEGSRNFTAIFRKEEVVHSWSDMIGGEHHDREWFTKWSNSFASREDWIAAVRGRKRDESPALAPDKGLADAVVQQLVSRLA
jgi:hypothetical protein